MYTLYHIKGKKWGCTKNLKQRLKSQKYTLADVHETIFIENIEEAAALEEKLNKECGYPWKASENYLNIIKIVACERHKGFTLEQCKKGGKTSGAIARDSGQLQNVCYLGGRKGGPIAGKIQSQKEYICENCGRIGRGNRFVSHMKKCNKL